MQMNSSGIPPTQTTYLENPVGISITTDIHRFKVQAIRKDGFGWGTLLWCVIFQVEPIVVIAI